MWSDTLDLHPQSHNKYFIIQLAIFTRTKLQIFSYEFCIDKNTNLLNYNCNSYKDKIVNPLVPN